jgi:hypothetical protein
MAELPPVTQQQKKELCEIFERSIAQMVYEMYVDVEWENEERKEHGLRSEVVGAIEEGCLEARTLCEGLKVKLVKKRYTYTITFETDEQTSRTLADALGNEYARRISIMKRLRPIECVDEKFEEEDV